MPSWPSAVEPGACYQLFRHLVWDSTVVLISLGETLIILSPEQCFGHLVVCLSKALGMMVRPKEEDEGGATALWMCGWTQSLSGLLQLPTSLGCCLWSWK